MEENDWCSVGCTQHTPQPHHQFCFCHTCRHKQIMHWWQVTSTMVDIDAHKAITLD
jgi:hypothetical protein